MEQALDTDVNKTNETKKSDDIKKAFEIKDTIKWQDAPIAAGKIWVQYKKEVYNALLQSTCKCERKCDVRCLSTFYDTVCREELRPI